MPVTECTLGNKPGFKWGGQGKCYTYTPGNESERNEAKKKAYIQGIATMKEEAKIKRDKKLQDIKEQKEKNKKPKEHKK